MKVRRWRSGRTDRDDSAGVEIYRAFATTLERSIHRDHIALEDNATAGLRIDRPSWHLLRLRLLRASQAASQRRG